MNIALATFAFNFLIFLSDIFYYVYLMLKMYRMVCFTRIIFDQLPLFNPYKWPLSIIRLLTKPYFHYWAKFLPNLKIGAISYEVSSIIALELLSAIISLTFIIRLSILALATHLSKFLYI